MIVLPNSVSLNREEKEAFKGSNTFACVVNNQYVEEKSFLAAELTCDDNLFYLTLWIGEGRKDRLTFVVKNEQVKESTYDLDNLNSRYLTYARHGDVCQFDSDEYYSGVLMIHRYDTANRIIAGSFEFMAYSGECDQLLRVEDGTFDVQYKLN